MNQKNSIKLIDELILRTEQLSFNEGSVLDSIRKEGEMVAKNIFGSNSEYIKSIQSADFYSWVYPIEKHKEIQYWNDGQRSLLNTFNTMKREMELFNFSEDTSIEPQESPYSENLNKVFLVHGHDLGMQQAVARSIEKLNLEAIILSEKNDDGLTVIEKFEKYASVCNFAVVLLSPDDIGSLRTQETSIKFRARQNVILELGYFIGKLGRQNVIAMVKDDASGKMEIPTDLAGLIYVQFDSSDGWKLKLVKRLRASGYKVSADELV